MSLFTTLIGSSFSLQDRKRKPENSEEGGEPVGARLLSMGLRLVSSCPSFSAVCRLPRHLPHGPSACGHPVRIVNRILWPFFARLLAMV